MSLLTVVNRFVDIERYRCFTYFLHFATGKQGHHLHGLTIHDRLKMMIECKETIEYNNQIYKPCPTFPDGMVAGFSCPEASAPFDDDAIDWIVHSMMADTVNQWGKNQCRWPNDDRIVGQLWSQCPIVVVQYVLCQNPLQVTIDPFPGYLMVD